MHLEMWNRHNRVYKISLTTASTMTSKNQGVYDFCRLQNHVRRVDAFLDG